MSMNLSEIAELSGMILGVPAVGYCLYRLKDKYVNFAERNELYDKELEKEDMKD